MKFKNIIRKDGSVIVEVVERDGQNCSEILKTTQSIGKQVSDETIGPDCDRVEEINGN